VNPPSAPHSPPSLGPDRADGALWGRLLALAMIFVPVLARAMMGVELLPGWEMDPLVVPPTGGAIGPEQSVAIDLLGLSGGVVLTLLTPGRARAWLLGLVAIGAFAAAWHGWFASGGDQGDRRVGLAWVSALLAAAALARLPAGALERRVVAALLLGFVVMLATRGVQQVFVEHPRTIAEWNANRDTFLAAQGWTPGSTMARSFERRLTQSDASGWFGLSNVYATLAAAGLVAMVGLSWAAFKVASRGVTVLVGAGALAAGAALALSQSKGGVVAAGGGLAALAALWMLRARGTRTPRPALGGLLAIAGVLAALAVIPIRGFLGERFSELSLLFRWYYLEAAGRMFASNPLVGVGPDGFQRAYLRAKNPLSPEEVVSPHSIFADYAATLGLLGLAWVGVLLVLVWWSGRAGAVPVEAVEARPTLHLPLDARAEVRIVAAFAAIATLTAGYVQRQSGTVDMALVWVLGLVAWASVSGAIVVLLRRVGRAGDAALAAGAIAALAHGQIDVAFSWPQSCGIVFGLLGVAAGGVVSESRPVGRGRAAVGVTLAVVACVATAGFLATYRGSLERAAEIVGPVASFGQRFTALSNPATAGPDADSERRRFVEDLSAAVGRRIEPSGAAVQRALAELERSRIARAIPILEQAAADHPEDWRPRREIARLHLRAAGIDEFLGRPGVSAGLDAAIAALSTGPATTDPSALRYLAQIYDQRAEHEPGQALAWITLAEQALAKAEAGDPFNADIPLRRMRALVRLGRAEEARAAAERVLNLDEFARLDREARGLRAEDRAEAERVARGG
jgi:O-antigen ligase